MAIRRGIIGQQSTFDPDYFICIDGEGINFDYIIQVLEQLITQPALGVVSCRKGRLGLGDPDREIVEKFELFIVSKIFGSPLIDGQCGCWGFKKDFLGVERLEGEGFEIELDFLIKLLRIGKKIYFIPVDITREPVDIPTFKSSDHKDKLEFICRILKLCREEIVGFVTTFEEKFGNLPTKYKEDIENIGYKPLPVGIVCTGTCDSCPYRLT